MSDSIKRDDELLNEITEIVVGIKGAKYYELVEAEKYTVDGNESMQLDIIHKFYIFNKDKQQESYNAGFVNRKFINDSQARRIENLERAYKDLASTIKKVESDE